MILAWLASLALFLSTSSFAGNVNSFSYASTNVTTGAYVTLVPSTPIRSTQIIFCDNSGHILKIATGSSGNEVDLLTVPLNACFLFPLNAGIPAGTRLSIRAVDASATTGYNTVSFLP
jgi:hypothetical protein